MNKLNVGDIAPNFKLPNQENKSVNLDDLKGHYVCIYFYPKDDTPGCTVQGCQFRDWNEQLKELDVRVFGISGGTLKSHQKFIEKNNFNFDLLLDENNEVINKYGMYVEKSMFGKKYMGIQRSCFLIDPNGKIVKIWEKADPQTNAKEVYDTVKLLNN